MPLKNVTDTCGAETRNGGKCQNPAMGNGRCRMHSGKALSGIASPNYKTGKYSRYLPTGLKERYEEARNSKDLTSLYDEISFLEASLADRLEKIYSGESVGLWKMLKSLFRDYRSAIADVAEEDEGTPEYAEAKSRETQLRFEMGELINRGYEVFTAFEAVQPMLEQKRKLADTENKRIKELTLTMSVDEVRAYSRALAQSVRGHLERVNIDEDQRDDILRGIQADINQLNAR